jgi:ATPase subunit of ABC transporter with duplicated ATPase domains
MKKFIIIKHNYSDYSEDRNEFAQRATVADSKWSEATEEEFEELQRIVQEHIKRNNEYRYDTCPYFKYEIIEWVDPNEVAVELATELKKMAKEKLESERKKKERAEKRAKTLEIKRQQKELAKLEELKNKYETN